MRAKSGGGINSTVVRSVGVRTGPASTNKVSPAGVAQYGRAMGDQIRPGGGHTGKNSAEPVFQGTMPKVMLGNAKATDVGKGGPGTGRTVMRSGSQSQHGPVAGSPKPQGRDILGGYGPDRRR
jgi:hypothetical protein